MRIYGLTPIAMPPGAYSGSTDCSNITIVKPRDAPAKTAKHPEWKIIDPCEMDYSCSAYSLVLGWPGRSRSTRDTVLLLRFARTLGENDILTHP